jgi:hypothetical protein
LWPHIMRHSDAIVLALLVASLAWFLLLLLYWL